MSRFCPYCGKQLSERSKFCPHCGKVSPQRERASSVALADAPEAVKSRRASASEQSAFNSRERIAERAVPAEPARQRASSQRLASGSSAAQRDGSRRFAPPTHALVGHYEQAGFGLRYGAWMFDFLITLIAIMGVTFAVTASSHRSMFDPVGTNRDLLLVAGFTLLLFIINFIVLAGLNGQSMGMRILGIYIVRVDGKRFNIKDAIVRHVIGYPISTVVLFLGFLWMLWDPRQQGWHDKIARTMVVMSR
ncbi:MAG TPA: RDD family protein [Blastocatellia bacterium]|nr:RDD family protein [Blastocatellia bacterium]